MVEFTTLIKMVEEYQSQEVQGNMLERIIHNYQESRYLQENKEVILHPHEQEINIDLRVSLFQTPSMYCQDL